MNILVHYFRTAKLTEKNILDIKHVLFFCTTFVQNFFDWIKLCRMSRSEYVQMHLSVLVKCPLVCSSSNQNLNRLTNF
jgi:hypothetical protein